MRTKYWCGGGGGGSCLFRTLSSQPVMILQRDQRAGQRFRGGYGACWEVLLYNSHVYEEEKISIPPQSSCTEEVSGMSCFAHPPPFFPNRALARSLCWLSDKGEATTGSYLDLARGHNGPQRLGANGLPTTGTESGWSLGRWTHHFTSVQPKQKYEDTLYNI